jgi:hypothetical protein
VPLISRFHRVWLQHVFSRNIPATHRQVEAVAALLYNSTTAALYSSFGWYWRVSNVALHAHVCSENDIAAQHETPVLLYACSRYLDLSYVTAIFNDIPQYHK